MGSVTNVYIHIQKHHLLQNICPIKTKYRVVFYLFAFKINQYF